MDRNEYYRRWYASSGGERQRKRVAARNARVRAENQRDVLDYLAGHPCVDCGEIDPMVLTFDHRGGKTACVSQLMGWLWPKIEAEIAKCDVRCANCHARKTAKERGWYTAKDASVV